MIFNTTLPSSGGGSVTGWTDISDSVEFVSDWTVPSHTVTNKLALLNFTTVVICMVVSDPEGVIGAVTVGDYPPAAEDATSMFYVYPDGGVSSGSSYSDRGSFWLDTSGETDVTLFVAYDTYI